MQLFDQAKSQFIRSSFPGLDQKVYDKPLIYLDNAATTMTHISVIEAMNTYYRKQHANPHRSAHYLANEATHLVEKAREKVKNFLNASRREEIIFTAGATAAFNLLAHSYRSFHLKEGDEIIISGLEHHSNWLPWVRLAQEKKCQLRIIPLQVNGELDLTVLPSMMNAKTKVIAITYVSHVTGKQVDLEPIIQQAHRVGAHVIVDAVQAAPHIAIDVQLLDVDFLVFSGHKIHGPTGIGILYGKKNMMDQFPPYQLGGGTVVDFRNDQWYYEALPHRLEAGTLPVASIIGLGAAVDFLMSLRPLAQNHTAALVKIAAQKLSMCPGIKLIATPPRVSLISFYAEKSHALDIGVQLNTQGIAVRTGQHCALPAMKALQLDGTVRVSFSVYNTSREIDILVRSIKSYIGR